jgi:molecular chaperone HtpG
MQKILKKIKENPILLSSIQNCEKEITPILQGFITNFPEYTDHSINHSKTILNYAEHLLHSEIKKLNNDEVYILIMAGFLHDIGMCPTNRMKKDIKESFEFKESGKKFEDYLRDIHHTLSYEYIKTHWKKLKIVNETYAEAIALVGMGHRVVNLLDFEKYNPEFPVRSGTDYVCLPFLAGILRLADELDITNDRTPELLYNEYFPSNKVSKKEWEKHKANYFVNFNRETIKITSKCFEKDLYYALIKQYNKIEGVIKYIQKLIYIIPQNDRGLRLDFIKLEKDIKTIGFIPKEIGFSFDLQNTINTFIGDNIYKNKFVAIRECLQNSIDTCRYKRQLSKAVYTPGITINFSNEKLIISDNGLGMDEFIVANYFAKLAKSYYTESKISTEFEAISQFGIGVFSYFLLCEYFEVESKQEGKDSIKFRVTKDADSYFYFYDNSTKKTNGTIITFFLKDEISFDEILKHIRHYLRFVEFPINVFYKERYETIISGDFEIDKIKFIGEHIERQYLNNLKQLEIVEEYMSYDNFEGNLSLLIAKNNDGSYIPIKEYDVLKTYHTSKIEISQKGIFVGNDEDHRLKNVIGKINFKRKNTIDLGRYHLKSRRVLFETTEKFYPSILRKIFDSWKTKDNETRRNLSRDFIGYYFDPHSQFDIKFIEQFFDDFFYKVYDGQKTEYLSVRKISNMDEFIIVRKDTPFDNYINSTVDLEEIYKIFRKPLIVERWAPPAEYLLNIFKKRENNITVKYTSKHWYFSVTPRFPNPNQKEIDLLELKWDGYNFDSNHICAYTNLWTEYPFNINHEIIKFYISNHKEISKSQELYSSFDNFLKETRNFIRKIHDTPPLENPKSEVDFLNTLLININSIKQTNFILTENDFPSWVNEKIKW